MAIFAGVKFFLVGKLFDEAKLRVKTPNMCLVNNKHPNQQQGVRVESSFSKVILLIALLSNHFSDLPDKVQFRSWRLAETDTKKKSYYFRKRFKPVIYCFLLLYETENGRLASCPGLVRHTVLN